MSDSPFRFEAGDLVVREVDEGDVGILWHWLQDPRVLEWYEGRDQVFDVARVRADFLHPDEGLVCCIVEEGGSPVGYVQWEALDKATKDSFGYPRDVRIVGIDQFLAGEHQGRGLGKRLVLAMCDHLCGVLGFEIVILDPQTSNARAIHVYESCGFTPVKVLEDAEHHEGAWRDCLLMERRCPGG